MEKQNKTRLDVMLDLETLGKERGSIILSVAMQTFQLDGGNPVKDFTYIQHISIFDSLLHHFTSDYETEEWWRSQSDAAKQSIRNKQNCSVGLEMAMLGIYELLKKWDAEYELYLWGRGVGSFDLPLLDEAMKRIVGDGYKTPWRYWAAMDVRSVQNFCQRCGLPKGGAETPHDALEDVKKQIREVQMCWHYVKVEKAL